ncbi:MOSC domain-containing protein [Verrucomicrobium sp. 3C]|uniref:MOSC domain-containing protein n=1 Tax=Verrucomicrobium sp. 3C TaxID=1134055 RepID=UPI000363875E|nr:MOSC domain-containing protein [Verrucomicrobium sp. 3C]
MSTGGKGGGEVISLRRYPVKSMKGEELTSARVGAQGIVGDRHFAFRDAETGKIVSAKYPAKWGKIFDLPVSWARSPEESTEPVIRFQLPGGEWRRSDDPSAAEPLGALCGRKVSLLSSALDAVSLEEYWPDIEGLAHREATTDEKMPPGTFFDAAPVHLVTTATLRTLRELYPEGLFEARRFRPNFVVALPEGERGFVENGWIGKRLRIGDSVRLEVTMGCGRCVMTTLPQGDLPQDPGILRTAARHNRAEVGVYAKVLSGGWVWRGAPLVVEED